MELKDLINKLRKQKLDEDIAAAEAANVLPAPTPSTTVTPQAYLNRTVAAIKKVKDIKADASIKVIDANGDDTKTLGTLDETNAQNKLKCQCHSKGTRRLRTARVYPIPDTENGQVIGWEINGDGKNSGGRNGGIAIVPNEGGGHSIIWRDIITQGATDLEKAAKAELYLHINPSLNKVNHE